MLRVLVIDDEPWARAELRLLLAERGDVEVVGEADSLDAAVAALAGLEPDLMFLDIRLRSESAFDLFDRTEVRCEVVFLTAYDEHALKAFEVNALDYLVKPPRPEDLDRALARAQQRPRVMPRPPARPLDPNDQVYLKESGTVRACRICDIAYVQAAEVYTEVHLRRHEVVLVRERLHAWEERLPSSFVRIHRSTLVNLAFVERLSMKDGRWQVELLGFDEPLAVSRRMVQAVKRQLDDA